MADFLSSEFVEVLDKINSEKFCLILANFSKLKPQKNHLRRNGLKYLSIIYF